MTRLVVVAVICAVVALVAGSACAQEEPRETRQVAIGAYFPMDMPSGSDASTGWSLGFGSLYRSDWYFGAEITGYKGNVEQGEWIGGQWVAADQSLTTWSIMGGKLIRSSDRRFYAGVGVGVSWWSGWSDVAGEVNWVDEGDHEFAWEIIAGKIGDPLGVQVRYRDAGVLNTGVTAALTYNWSKW